MTILPGGWGARQSGVEDHVPSATDELMFWLHAIDVSDASAAARRLRSISLEAVEGAGDGRTVVVGAITTFNGSESPLRWAATTLAAAAWRCSSVRRRGPGTSWRVDGRSPCRHRPPPWPAGAWTRSRLSDDEEVEFSAAADATLFIDGLAVQRADIEALPAADKRVRVNIVDADGRPTAARVRVHARDGRYLPPLGHRDTVNPGLYEDVGADLELGGSVYAYVDGSFEIDLPADGAELVAVAGPDARPISATFDDEDVARGSVQVAFGAVIRPASGTWVSGDSHVHYLSPSTALLQARAEGVNVVHLLATQWGDLHTSVADLGGDQVDAAGEHAVWVGSENRQNMLGHVGLVGAARPILPFASGGAPEGRIGGAVDLLMADWLDRNRVAGGLNIAAHFPLPLAEIAADIALGLVDALEFQMLRPGPGRDTHPGVVPLPRCGLSAAHRGGHRPDVRGRAPGPDPDLGTPRRWRPADLRRLVGGHPGGTHVRDVRTRPRTAGRRARPG